MTRGVIFKGYSEQLWQFHFLFDFTKSCFECTFLYAIMNHHVIIIWLGSHEGYGRQGVGGCQQCRQFHFIPYFPSIISSLFPHYFLLLLVLGTNILLPQKYPFLSFYVLFLILESNDFLLQNCVTQLMLYTGDKLSSPIFPLWVSVSGIGVTRPNLHFFQYIQAYKPFADPVPPNTKQYQLILTKYQPVSSYTDPVPSSTTIHHLVRYSSANWIVSLFTSHLMSHAQYICSI